MWQKNKMKIDPAYRQNQKLANQVWQKRNPDYWKQYRERNQQYTDKNRKFSKERMRIKRQVTQAVQMFAKMDSSLVDYDRLSGYCVLVPLGDMFAKMDAKFLNIQVFQEHT
jgi:hypothetical protein